MNESVKLVIEVALLLLVIALTIYGLTTVDSSNFVIPNNWPAW